MPALTQALIGSNGFVGGALAATHDFAYQFHRGNREEMQGCEVDLAVCAAAPGTKWFANANPEVDRAVIDQLMGDLRGLRAKKVVLISTVDVFAKPLGVYEDTPVATDGLHAYGVHRHRLESMVAAEFDAHIIRLPGLFGMGLKKNALFDLLHGSTEFVDPRAVLQWYSLSRLWVDIERVMTANIPIMHLATEPIVMQEIIEGVFGMQVERELTGAPARYDLRTRHAQEWGTAGDYILSKEAVLQDIAQFVATWHTGKV